MVKRNGFETQTVRMRWIDYARIRAVYPPLENETAFNYFRRLALWLKENKQ